MSVLLAPRLRLAEEQVFVHIASELTGHAWWVILLSAAVAGWLMGVMSWLITGGRETISQVVFVWLIATAIGLAGLHHSITGSAEVLAGVLAGPELSMSDFLHFLIWTTLGNASGGIIFAALVYYSLEQVPKLRENEPS